MWHLPGLALALASSAILAQIHRPFPPGYSMGNLGTIVWDDGISGRQPWTPAAFLRDSLRFGISVAGIDYYDDMDNFEERSISDAMAGGWFESRYITVKAAYEQFSALQMYDEQIGTLSVGTNALRFLSVSVQARGVRVGLRSGESEHETLGELGATLWLPRRYVAVSLAVEHLTVEAASVEGVSSDPVIRLGLHTRRHRIGALGVVCEVTARGDPLVRFMVGQEVWVHRVFGLSAAVSTEPFMVGVGATFVWRTCGTSVSFVHHPVLGWSKGFEVDYAHR
jgi:hypothetical protein